MLPGPQFYTVRKGKTLDKLATAISSEKFGRKAMVWQAICECGKFSRPFITTDVMSCQTYIDECLQKRLFPMIRKHKRSVVFWPDLASCHYAKATLKWLKDLNIIIVSKDMNPPNCSEIRSIERFWGFVKAYLRKHVKAADTVKTFERLN